jgi:hypothetical protein
MPIWFGFPVSPIVAPSISVLESRRQPQDKVLWYVVPRDDLPGDVRDQLWGGEVRHAGPNVDMIGASAFASAAQRCCATSTCEHGPLAGVSLHRFQDARSVIDEMCDAQFGAAGRLLAALPTEDQWPSREGVGLVRG